MMTYHSEQGRVDYAPPVLGNGNMSLTLDGEGTQSLPERESGRPAQTIWRAGRRYREPFDRPLIPFGRLIHSLPAADAFEQALDAERALLKTRSRHGGMTLETESFVCMGRDLLVMRKTFSQAGDYALTWLWASNAPSTETPRRVAFSAEADERGIDVRFTLDGQQMLEGGARLQADRPVRAEISGNAFTLHVSVQAGETVTFSLMIADELDGDWPALLADMRRDAEDPEALRAAHERDWLDYSRKTYVEFGEADIESVWKTALYHLRCHTTRWSIPVGLNDTNWNGRYFAFDEFFPMDGLLTAGHPELARRVSEFRLQGLQQALKRASRFDYPVSICARYPWETVETGEEATPVGFWYDHVFHMANVAIGAFENYRYAGDVALLERYWEMIRACANFFLRHMVYRLEGGRTVIGKCTDLERLGCDVENAYMTTCSAIQTLRVAAEAADILERDAEFAADCRKTADALQACLPRDEEKYVPHPACDQKSIAMFTGTYPYACIPADDPLQERAIRDYIGQELTYGNMYNLGHGVASWYAAWKAIVYARLRDGTHALPALCQAAASRGCFDELWEINEEGVRIKPWFATAAGTCLTGVNAMLLDGGSEEITIAPALHESCERFAFRLPARGDLMIECRAQNSAIETLRVTGGSHAREASVTVLIPARFAPNEPAEDGFVRRVVPVERENV